MEEYILIKQDWLLKEIKDFIDFSQQNKSEKELSDKIINMLQQLQQQSEVVQEVDIVEKMITILKPYTYTDCIDEIIESMKESNLKLLKPITK